jgi:hypothetical protein
MLNSKEINKLVLESCSTVKNILTPFQKRYLESEIYCGWSGLDFQEALEISYFEKTYNSPQLHNQIGSLIDYLKEISLLESQKLYITNLSDNNYSLYTLINNFEQTELEHLSNSEDNGNSFFIKSSVIINHGHTSNDIDWPITDFQDIPNHWLYSFLIQSYSDNIIQLHIKSILELFNITIPAQQFYIWFINEFINLNCEYSENYSQWSHWFINTKSKKW